MARKSIDVCMLAFRVLRTHSNDGFFLRTSHFNSSPFGRISSCTLHAFGVVLERPELSLAPCQTHLGVHEIRIATGGGEKCLSVLRVLDEHRTSCCWIPQTSREHHFRVLLSLSLSLSFTFRWYSRGFAVERPFGIVPTIDGTWCRVPRSWYTLHNTRNTYMEIYCSEYSMWGLRQVKISTIRYYTTLAVGNKCIDEYRCILSFNFWQVPFFLWNISIYGTKIWYSDKYI